MNLDRGIISVIVPVYNVAPYLERCVDSIIRQTYTELEIILVDDGSTDMSGELCDQLKERDDRIIVIHKGNGGLSDARNAGLDRAAGEFISFIDSDDYIDVEMYSRMLEPFRDVNVSMVACDMCIITGKTRKRCHLFEERRVLNKEETYLSFFKYDKDNIGSTVCNKIFRKETIGNMRFKVGLISEDIEFLYRYIYKCKSVACLNNQYYFYVKRPGSITTQKFFDGRLDCLNIAEDIKIFVKRNMPDLYDYSLLYELQLLINSWNNVDFPFRYRKQKKYIRKRIRKNRKDYEKLEVLYSKNYYNYASFAIMIHCYTLFSFLWKGKVILKKYFQGFC